MTQRIGVDTGGTFTDVCLFDETSRTMSIVKVPSTPGDPGLAVVAGVREVLGGEGSFEQVSYFAHGTTVATNALLQQRGARVGLITTEGLRDLLELGRQRRPRLYDLTARKPDDLVPRDLRREVRERMDYLGGVSVAADPGDIREQALALREQGVEAVAVCLLYSYLNPAHERQVREVLAEVLPEAFLSVSHEVLPEFREFERLSTTVVNAFVGPVMRGYLARLREALHAGGLRAGPKVTQSNGGVISFRQAETLPVRTVLSGPSTGVVGAAYLAKVSGVDDVITFDMGGTSSDIAVVRDARPVASHGTQLDGRPIHAPMLDISTVGAGGGSLAWVDEGGHLKVGPQSAGADPGPACYGAGNDEPTVTDANVVLGVLNQERLLGGSMPIDASLAFKAVERLSRRIGTSVEEAAQGIVSVVTANMAKAIRLVSVQRGYDPADYALVAFGGAGPLHSARLAAELGVRRVLVPPTPGAMSAIGMLMTDVKCDFTRTHRVPLDADGGDRIELTFAQLRRCAEEWFAEEGVAAGARRLRQVADLRYLGQNYEIPVDAPPGRVDGGWLDTVRRGFEEAHRLRYGYADERHPVELVTFRVEAVQEVARAEPRKHEPARTPVADTRTGTRSVYLPELGGRVTCPVHDRALLSPGHEITGPALLEQYDTTTLLLPGQRALVDPYLMLDCQFPKGER